MKKPAAIVELIISAIAGLVIGAVVASLLNKDRCPLLVTVVLGFMAAAVSGIAMSFVAHYIIKFIFGLIGKALGPIEKVLMTILALAIAIKQTDEESNHDRDTEEYNGAVFKRAANILKEEPGDDIFEKTDGICKKATDLLTKPKKKHLRQCNLFRVLKAINS
jgi:hypothetical protein